MGVMDRPFLIERFGARIWQVVLSVEGTGFCLLLFVLYCGSGCALTSPNAGAGPRALASALAAPSFLCKSCGLHMTFGCCPCGSLTLGRSPGVSFSVLSGGQALGPSLPSPRPKALCLEGDSPGTPAVFHLVNTSSKRSITEIVKSAYKLVLTQRI